MLDAASRIAVALDCSSDEAIHLARKLCGHALWMKVGMTLYYACGPEIVGVLHELGMRVFLDLKLHDIPYQVSGAAQAAARAGADLLTVHALGGPEMIAAAREGVEAACASHEERTRILAVTILTSTNEASLKDIGIQAPLADEVERLACLACSSGADGIVCSPLEARSLRYILGSDPLIVCPGVRPQGTSLDDQSRTSSPAQAIRNGASMLVVGRPIVRADDPLAAFQAIAREIS